MRLSTADAAWEYFHVARLTGNVNVQKSILAWLNNKAVLTSASTTAGAINCQPRYNF